MPGIVRPFVDGDVPEVADLHRRVFRPLAAGANGSWSACYRKYFSDVFLNQALSDGRISSLVYEHGGQIRGFLGVMPRRMCFDGQPVLMAVCSQFVVDATQRGQIGLRLLKHCFAGPQDLTISDEAGEATRRVWEWCGGESVLPYSMRWISLFRPAEYALSLLARRKAPWSAPAAAAVGRIIDVPIARLASGRFQPSRPAGSRQPLDETAFLDCLREGACDRSLSPEYDSQLARWTFARARCASSGGTIHNFVVRTADGRVAGWCVYCLGRDSVAEVLQIGAPRGAINDVVDHVLRDAMENGAVAVSGRLEPALAPALAAKRAMFYRGPFWTLIHSPRLEVRDAVHRGDAFLTRLEGEWCLRFQ